MSRIHVRFLNRRIVNGAAIYCVESPDFRDFPLVGELRIDLSTYRYEFVPMGSLEGKKIIPPEIFDLPSVEQDRVIERDYQCSEFGGVTRRIACMVQQLREKQVLPDEFYGVT